MGVIAGTADIALEKQCYKTPHLENNPLPQSTDWQLKFREEKKPQKKYICKIKLWLWLQRDHHLARTLYKSSLITF